MAKNSRKAGQKAVPLPKKQRLVMDFKPKIKDLAAEYTYITYSIDDADVSQNLSEVFEKLGFITHSVSGKDRRNLIQNLVYSFRKSHLILLHYPAKIDGSTIISVLNEIKASEPFKSFKHIVPIFISSPDSARQKQLFRLLSVFDMRYAIFLTPGATAEANLETLLEELVRYHKILKKGIVLKEWEKPEVARDYDEKAGTIASYKELVRKGEEIMVSDPAAAIELFTQAIELKPDFPMLIRRGDAYYKIREYIPAIHDYREAHLLEKDEAAPYAKIGACCFALVKAAAGDDDMENARRWHKLGIDSLNRAEQIAARLTEREEYTLENILESPYKSIISALAEADLRGLGMRDAEAEITDTLARVFHNIQEVDFSAAGLDVDVRIDYAVLLTRQKNYIEAENIFRELIRQDPARVGPAFNNYAVELRKNGEEGKAFNAYLELLKYDIPDRDIVLQNFVTAGRRYARALRDEKKYEQAATAYKNILIYAVGVDGREWVLCDLAMAFMEMGDPAQASARLMEALFLNPGLMEDEGFEPYGELRSLKDEMVKRLAPPDR